MEDKRIGFKDQLKYKDQIEGKGLKKIHVAEQIGITNVMLSMFINGRLYMPEAVKLKLDKYLDN